MNMPTSLLSRLRLRGSLAALAAAMPLSFMAAHSAQAAVMISQVYGGGGNTSAVYTNDYVELYNSGADAVSLSGYTLQYASAAGTAWTNNTALSGVIPAGGYFLIRLASGGAVGAAIPVTPDVIGGTNISATTGKLALVSNATPLTGACPTGGAIEDFVGYGTAGCFEGALAPTPSATLAITRANAGATGCLDTNNNASDFATNAPNPRSSASLPQACRAASSGGGGGGGAAAVARAIYDIQGVGKTSPYVGTNVVTRGVVTKVNSNGFFIQDLTGDGNAATSDGIFVFTSTTAYADAVVGNLVDVTGTVAEFNVGSSTDTAAHTVTEISPTTAVTFVGSGYSIAPTLVTLPEVVNDDLEKYEGMLVTIAGPLVVNQGSFLGQYGQLTLAAGGRLETPTNRYRPGTAQAIALADENARRRIILDDGSSVTYPNPIPYIGAGIRRAGDTLATLTGVLDYGLATASAAGAGDYKIHPTVAPVFVSGNLRTNAPDAVGGNLKVASFNVLNYFTAFTDGGGTAVGCTLGSGTSTANCRGADNAAEFTRQQTKIVKAMAALDADVLGLMEIQNNGNVAAQNLVDALNAQVGAGTYVTTALPADTGTDAIRVAMIYKPTKLTPASAPVSDTNAINNRPTLAQTFTLGNGEKFTLFVNHLKSKGSCPSATAANAGNYDAGDGQGCWNLQRVQQAQQLRTFVAQRTAAAGSTDALLIGDFNAYGQEDPIFDLTSNGYVDQVGRFSSFGYSYVFDGAAGRLDHAIATASLSAKVNRVAHWHINADEPTVIDYNTEKKAPLSTCGAGASSPCPADPYTASPYRASDHDPVVIGLNLYNKITVGTAASEAITGNAGDDLIIGGVGSDVLTGGAGSNGFAYTSMRDAGDTITDFVPGKDRIDLSVLLAGLGIASSTAIANGNVLLSALGSDTQILIDTDGNTGPVRARTLVTLRGVAVGAIDPARDLGLSSGPAARAAAAAAAAVRTTR